MNESMNHDAVNHERMNDCLNNKKIEIDEQMNALSVSRR